MSFDADNPLRTKRSLERERWRCTSARAAALPLALAAAVLSSAAGCALDGMRPISSVGVGAADRGTCEGLYVQSIWKGEDLSGPECASYGSSADQRGHEPEYDRRRVQKVCEQTQMRTILSGEASTSFTLQACAPHEPRYQQARLGKACKEVSRERSRAQEDLTPAQSAACKTYLAPDSSRMAVAMASGAGARSQWVGSRAALATVPERTDASAGPNLAAHVLSSGAVAAPSVDEHGADAPTCEDRYVESIWKGADLTGGAECAAQLGADGSTPNYRASRIQNVCEGAEVRAVRTGTALPAFTAQACQGIFAARAVPAAAAAAAPVVAAEPVAAAPEAPVAVPGLDERTIAATVDSYWRSIGRDCMAVAPRSSGADSSPSPDDAAAQQPGHTPVSVTIHVAASGQVSQVSARVRGHDALETCIERSVRSWIFPAAERDTEVGLPLVFVGE